MDYRITRFIEDTAQVEVVYNNLPPFMIDLPVDENGNVPFGDALDNYIKGTLPIWHFDRLAKLANGVTNAALIRSIVQPLPESTTDNAATARELRNKLLAATDFMMLPDAVITEQEKEAVVVYRDALRKLPESAGFPNSIMWPLSPFEEPR
jgi:hypothetical protein